MLGIRPELEFKDMLFSSTERYSQPTQSSGTVEIDVGIILKDFNLHGVTLYSET
jgi:hypothetical protein